VQYVDFLDTNMDGERYDKMLPSVADLCEQFHMDPETAFLFYRPAFAHRIKVSLRETSAAGQDSRG